MWLGIDLRTDTKNMHCYVKEIGLRAQHLLTIPVSTFDIIERTWMITYEERDFSFL